LMRCLVPQHDGFFYFRPFMLTKGSIALTDLPFNNHAQIGEIYKPYKLVFISALVAKKYLNLDFLDYGINNIC
jgi:hypothetical protein